MKKNLLKIIGILFTVIPLYLRTFYVTTPIYQHLCVLIFIVGLAILSKIKYRSKKI